MSQTKRKRRSVPTQVRYEVDTSKNYFDEIITLPNPDDSGSDNSGSDVEWDEEVPEITYKLACKTYTEDQAKLEGNYDFCWADDEKKNPDVIEDHILLKKSAKKNILDSETVELFETFFSIEIKQYIIDACRENDFDLQLQDLNTFLGIIIVTSFNKRKSQRDYWSTDPFISCDVISSAMSRNTFEEIKSRLKYSKAADHDVNDNAWRVRALLKLFQRYILKFGVWRTALSIDEMMAKSYARTSLK